MTQHITFCHINTQSLSTKGRPKEIYTTLKALNNPDIIVFTETWLNKSLTADLICKNFRMYDSISTNYDDKSRGVAIMYKRKKLSLLSSSYSANGYTANALVELKSSKKKI